MTMRHKLGFTLIELLIVVAIIAILAAIAVPNFLEAQTRAKVSRAKADMNALGTGLETYHIDWNTYPYQNPISRSLAPPDAPNSERTLERLTTPVSYLTGISSFKDPFNPKGAWSGAALGTYEDITNDTPQWEEISKVYWYMARNGTYNNGAAFNWLTHQKPSWWITESAGPDAIADAARTALNHAPTATVVRTTLDKMIYDASNGTTSRGSIWRVGGTPSGPGQVFYRAVQTAQ
jgi:type II secretion system protein G